MKNNVERYFTLFSSLVACLLGCVEIYKTLTSERPGEILMSYNFRQEDIMTIGLDLSISDAFSSYLPIDIKIYNPGEKEINDLILKITSIEAVDIKSKNNDASYRTTDDGFLNHKTIETTLRGFNLKPGEIVNLDEKIHVRFNYQNSTFKLSPNGGLMIPIYVSAFSKNHEKVNFVRYFYFSDKETLKTFGMDFWDFNASKPTHYPGAVIRKMPPCGVSSS